MMHSLSFLPFILFLFFLHRLIVTRGQRNQPPTPPTLPIIGNLHQLGVLPHRSLQALSEKYGDIMLVYLGYTPTLVVSSASVAKEILKTHDAVFSSRPKLKTFDKLLYNSVDVASVPYGDYWRQMKSVLVLRLLSNKKVQSYKAIRENETDLLVQNVRKKCGEPVNLSEMFYTFTNDVVCRVAIGRKYCEEESGTVFKELLEEFTELLMVFSVGVFIPWLSWIDKLSGLDKKLESVAARFDAVLDDVLQEHIDRHNKQGTQTQNGEDGEEVKDFVDVLLDVQREMKTGFPIERDHIKAQLVDAFTAGTHTISTVLAWAMTELLRHPAAMKELQKEVTEITCGKERITEDDLKKMQYLKAVIKETLRLYPPFPMLTPHKSIQEAEISGYHIPAGTQVFINAWAIQRDPHYWENPNDFRPERFLNSPVEFKGQDYELIPFGSGRRICPAISFATASIELAIANLVREFDWVLPPGVRGENLDMSETGGLTLNKKAPVLAVATPRLLQSA